MVVVGLRQRMIIAIHLCHVIHRTNGLVGVCAVHDVAGVVTAPAKRAEVLPCSVASVPKDTRVVVERAQVIPQSGLQDQS